MQNFEKHWQCLTFLPQRQKSGGGGGGRGRGQNDYDRGGYSQQGSNQSTNTPAQAATGDSNDPYAQCKSDMLLVDVAGVN